MRNLQLLFVSVPECVRDSEPPKAPRLRSLKAMVRHTMIVSVFALITQNTYI